MDIAAAAGLAAAPALVSGVLGTIDWIFGRYLPADAKRLVALLLGVGYAFLANSAGVVSTENAAVAVLVGIAVGLSAMGWKREVINRLRTNGS